MAPTVNLEETHLIYHLPAFALLVSMQRWHCKIHSPESSHRGSSASNEMHRWCMTRCVTEHPPPKWLQEASSATFFYAPLQLLWIQFKCKATKKDEAFMPAMYVQYLFLSLARLFPPVSWSHRSHWLFYWLWLAAWPIRCWPNEDGSPLFALLQYPSNILQPIFSPTAVFCCWTAAQTNVVAFFLLSQIQHVIVFGPIKRSEGIVKFYYWGPLSRIYCPDNSLHVLQ